MLVLGLGVECKVEKAYRKKKREIGCRVSFSTEMGWARESYCRKNSFGQIMELTAISFATTLVALLISSPAIAQTPPVPILPPSPAPAPHHVNLTELLSVAGPYHTFLNYLLQTRVIDTFQNQANNSEQGITIFVPKDSAFALLKSSDLANLTDDQLRTLLLYHAFPKYYSLSDFRNLSNMNPVTTFAGGQYTLNVTDIAGIIHVVSSVASYCRKQSEGIRFSPKSQWNRFISQIFGVTNYYRRFFIQHYGWSVELLHFGCFKRSDASLESSTAKHFNLQHFDSLFWQFFLTEWFT
ncbi:hypothetical protein GW17_00046728 [Ensete ventricosum]|nr:hypothetical protein GW17_00046728 [Ensete ventricosum]